MDKKPMDRIREGLGLVIDGLLENAVEIVEENGPLDRKKNFDNIILTNLDYQMKKVEDYLQDAKIYGIENLELLKIKYETTKRRLGLK